ncbi:MAG: hypothetical protein A2W52_00310 [Candidatus Taylorbacteria bacterium RIFCSPHIGHO2_02_49_25]|uniref:Aminotransferase class I/classII large domain-containing protein n=1 Tax=Candidatus Taylorbacteria bacterium RIFCSPHIGHO2_02_49_25 TaxID=1802305 RepID=A0A1G2MJ59_9BACT|nr:MAG: Aminotransferase [Parcubacteria group bacterium GW2011_GWF2_50_9]OHA20718.1 MAG: hypothetical protein A2759_03860 [Candidatus Taylorbacteria bacterium RIFCSPHIGHO2_01_FULL_49_60]OHA23041.1 MAG: hypothetical protein A2W52_00310 [Candidatus Taylorbacteria bacterium RIFCSPHIGHO2_02_49_25]OHA35294.1 MAG: hypothetical protein A3B27_03420 [Candidatus Taylorbacteria bacterium RIFCSPLOWO2_01_FULL_50_130]OHA36378.1 MAG: hypothetical protein A2W65_02645 [Candidatus Taylorbacteria bacterium RIFCSP
MPIRLTAAEKRLAKRLAEIKKKSGSHSPSPAMLRDIAGATVKHDFCFLSNSHATDLFLKYWKRNLGNIKRLRKLIELYPSQNRTLAEKLAHSLLLKGALPSSAGGMSTTPDLADSATPFLKGDNIFVGNGATEVIQAVLHNFSGRKILVPVPTFSPYLEFVPKGVKIILHRLEKRKDFRLDIHTLLAQVKKEKPDTVVIINPNNPDGGFVSARNVRLFLTQLKRIQTVILDESFIHFANTSTRVLQGSARLVREFPNLAVIKSLSKDFGIAGLRLSYGVMSEKRVSSLLENGYLWNVSGFGEYFLNLLNNRGFMEEYEKARLLAIRERDVFFMQLSTLKDIKVYPSSANLFLVELLDGSTANNLTVRLLARYGIYIRSCGDKVGLRGEFFRIASRKRAENNALIAALTDIFSQ